MRDGCPTMGIHSGKGQQEYDWVLNEFRHGQAPILVATDVTSRGLDVEDVKFVIGYDYPNSSKEFIKLEELLVVHSTKQAQHTLFFTPDKIKQVSDLMSVLSQSNQEHVFQVCFCLKTEILVVPGVEEA